MNLLLSVAVMGRVGKQLKTGSIDMINLLRSPGLNLNYSWDLRDSLYSSRPERFALLIYGLPLTGLFSLQRTNGEMF
jgi:hypothetical protein